jgi:hypothetical protein
MTKENNQIMNLASEILAQFFYKEYNAGKKEIIPQIYREVIHPCVQAHLQEALPDLVGPVP